MVLLKFPIPILHSLSSRFSASVGVLFIGIALLYANLRGRLKERRRLLGSLALSGGILAILVAVFVYLVNMEDEGPRCLGSCAPSLFQYYQEVYVSMTILGVIGLITGGFGIRLLMRKENPIKQGTLSMLDNRKNDTFANKAP